MTAPTEQFLKKLQQAGNGQLLQDSNEAEQVLRETFKINGPSPAFVLGDGLHFTNVMFNAQLKQVSLIDPLGQSFPKKVTDAIMQLCGKGKTGQWKYTAWSIKLQHDGGNCGIWAIWIHEQWMQYWQQKDINQSFEDWSKQTQYVVPIAADLRRHYHYLMQAAAAAGPDGRTGLEKSLQVATQRMSVRRDLLMLQSQAAEVLHSAYAIRQPSLIQNFHMHGSEGVEGDALGALHSFKTKPYSSSKEDAANLMGTNKKANEDGWIMVTGRRKDMLNRQTNDSSKAQAAKGQRTVETAEPGQNEQQPAEHSTKQETSAKTPTRDAGDPSRKRTVGGTGHNVTPSHCKQQRTQPQTEQTARCDKITVLTHNIMGTTTMIQEVAMTAADRPVDIRIFTETKLTDESSCQRELEACMPLYKFYHTCKTSKDSAGRKHKRQKNREGAAGVTIAVHNSLLTQNTVNPKYASMILLQKDIVKVSASRHQATRTREGVYVPRNQDDSHAVYKMLRREVPKAEQEVAAATGRKCFTVMAGDWNAGLLPGDRPVLTSRDAAHQQLMKDLGMVPTEPLGELKRAASHHPQAEGLQGSRIDDILASKQLIHDQECHNELICGTGDSNHSALLSAIPLTHMLLLRPGPDNIHCPDPEN